MKTLTINLFEEKRPEINIRVSASINEKGDLLIEGFDSGKLVRELRGEWDYEYYLTVKSAQKDHLKEHLGEQLAGRAEDAALLEWLQKHFNDNNAFSSIQLLLDQLKLKYEFFSWK